MKEFKKASKEDDPPAKEELKKPDSTGPGTN
jgi:hypothetical protein